MGAAFVTQLHFPIVTRSMNEVGIYPYSVNLLAYSMVNIMVYLDSLLGCVHDTELDS